MATKPDIIRSTLRQLPPQVCPVALGLIGISGCITQWSKMAGVNLAPLPLTIAQISATLLVSYLCKVFLEPRAFRVDCSEPGGLSALSALPAAFQACVVRLIGPRAPATTEATIVLCCMGSLTVSGFFLLRCYQRGQKPDPSWFPAMLLTGMTVNSTSAMGAEWLKPFTGRLFWMLVMVYYPLKAIISYRILVSKNKMAVSPHAGMNVLMAPASFYTVVHFSAGMPGGQLLALVLFVDSTAFFLVTMTLLYFRSSAWINAFHPSYAAFTFPFAATATAAVQAFDKLPAISGPVLWAWATALMLGASVVIGAVLARFLMHISTLPKADNAVGNADKDKKN